jgi:hypothetical protein
MNPHAMVKLAIFAFAAVCVLQGVAQADVRVENQWFVVNGERFFVKGIGYSVGGGRGGIPWERTFDGDLVRRDIALMKNAGFNTVRNWNAYKAEELKLFRANGLMVIQGYWFHFPHYLADEAYAKKTREELATVVRMSKQFDNVLFYTITNEPKPGPILDAGLEAYEKACRELKAAARGEDPDCLVTFSHMSADELLDQSTWDVIFLNSYMYVPNTVTKSLKYRGHIEWLRERHAEDKPFVIGEFGLSVSRSGEGNMGYGGNTLEEQRDGCLHMYQSLIDAGAQGGCLFHWRDGWFKLRDPMTHDDHAEEWYGILGIEDHRSDPRGTPRPVYDAFRKYNQVIVTEPRQMVVYPDDVPVEAFVTQNITAMQCRATGGDWIEMKRAGQNWRTSSLKGLAVGRHTVEIEARLSLNDIKHIRRTVDLVVGERESALPRLTLTTDKPTYEYGETAVVTLCATNRQGAPMPNTEFVATFQNHRTGEARNVEDRTGDDGRYEITWRLFCKPTLITLGVGGETTCYGATHRMTDATGIEVTGLPRRELERIAANDGRLIAGFEYASKAALDEALGRVLSGLAEYRVEREAENTKGGQAIRLTFAPTAPHGWGYAELTFDSHADISQERAISYRLHGDGSGNTIKLMLIDSDGERWFDEAVLLDFRGWKRIVFSARCLQRDPHDGVGNGDTQPNPDKVAGVAFVMVSKGAENSSVIVDGLAAHGRSGR